MKKFTVIIMLLLFLAISNIQAQKADEPILRNNVYFELGGAAFFYSLNYERLLLNSKKHNLAPRIGFEYINLFGESKREFVGIPIGISYLKHLKKNIHLETGFTFSVIYDNYYPLSSNNLGQTYYSDQRTEEFIIFPSLRLGIRKQPEKKAIFWNTSLQFSKVSLYDVEKKRTYEGYYLPFASFGIGYSF
ncbi:MAG: hypothetical protein ACNS60_12240 [Candidatus Cyclobacteriaceae bacterium M2_1C_046]